MTCKHCAFACINKGEDMSFEMFKTIIDRWGDLLRHNREEINIGGGEPTLHPQFWDFIKYAMKKVKVWLATNGTNIPDFLLLNEMAKKGHIGLTLSLDKYHDRLNPDIIKYFRRGMVRRKKYPGWIAPKGSGIFKEIRTVSVVKYGGRAKNGKKVCPCPRLHIKPNGNIYGCGCENATVVGTVEKGFFREYEMFIPQLRLHKPKFRVCSKIWCPSYVNIK